MQILNSLDMIQKYDFQGRKWDEMEKNTNLFQS